MPDTPVCTCEVEFDMKRQEGRVFMCPLHTAAPDLYQALEELLKGGEHAGPCDNCDEDGDFIPDAGPCEFHILASERRKKAAKEALRKCPIKRRSGNGTSRPGAS